MGELPEPPDGLFAELGRWRDKAEKRGKLTLFTSDIIPDWLNAEIVAAQAAIGPEDAFSFLKQVPLSVRMKAEREIQRKVQAILEKRKRQAAQAIRRGEPFDYDGLADELRAAVMPELRKLTVDNALRLSVETGISFDPAVINQEALQWAQQYSYDLVQGLTNTTRDQIREATSAFVQVPGMTIGDVESLIEPAFGPVRAEMIASTEVTRAYSMATNQTQELLRRETPELVTVLVWNSVQDEYVCPVCGPLEGAPKSEWEGQFPKGPPAHPRCRCSTSIRFDTPEQLTDEFGARQAEREAWLREQGLWKEPKPEPAPIAPAIPVPEGPTQEALIETALGRAIMHPRPTRGGDETVFWRRSFDLLPDGTQGVITLGRAEGNLATIESGFERWETSRESGMQRINRARFEEEDRRGNAREVLRAIVAEAFEPLDPSLSYRLLAQEIEDFKESNRELRRKQRGGT